MWAEFWLLLFTSSTKEIQYREESYPLNGISFLSSDLMIAVLNCTQTDQNILDFDIIPIQIMTDHNHTKATYTRLYISILKKINQRSKIWLGFFIYQKHFRTPPERAIFYAKVSLSALEKNLVWRGKKSYNNKWINVHCVWECSNENIGGSFMCRSS